MICALLALRPISHITKKTSSYLHSTEIEQMTKTMVIFKRGAIFLCCIRCDPIPPQTSVQRLEHTRNVTTCCSPGAVVNLSRPVRLSLLEKRWETAAFRETASQWRIVNRLARYDHFSETIRKRLPSEKTAIFES